MIIVIWIFTILFLLYPILFLFQDSYSLIPLSKWIEYLFKDAAVDFSDWLALYFAVLIGLVGVYFTIVSILLDKKNITPFTCLKHTLFFEDYLLITAIVANTLMALFCFPYINTLVGKSQQKAPVLLGFCDYCQIIESQQGKTGCFAMKY